MKSYSGVFMLFADYGFRDSWDISCCNSGSIFFTQCKAIARRAPAQEDFQHTLGAAWVLTLPKRIQMLGANTFKTVQMECQQNSSIGACSTAARRQGKSKHRLGRGVRMGSILILRSFDVDWREVPLGRRMGHWIGQEQHQY